MSVYSDTVDELRGHLTDLRGNAIPVYERRVGAEGERERGASQEVPYVAVDVTGLASGHRNASYIYDLDIAVYSRPDAEEVAHDVRQVVEALQTAGKSWRSDLSIPKINDRQEGLQGDYQPAIVTIQRAEQRA